MHFVVRFVGLVVAYLLAAKIGLVFGTVNGSVTIFWPAGGIALAALLLGGMRYLPAVCIGAFLAAVMVDAPPIFALGSVVGNTLETWLAYFLLKRFGNADLALNHIKDFFLVILLGGLISPVASATLGPLSLLGTGLISPDALTSIMWRWWRADALGIVFFTPLILVCAQRKSWRSDAARAAEILALWLLSFFIGQSVFLGWNLPGVQIERSLGLVWIFPMLVWAGLRTGRRNTAHIQLLFVTQAMLSAYWKVGYFADDFASYGLANFWMFAMLLAIAGMSLAILSAAQRNAMYLLALNAKVFAVSRDGIIITDAANNIVDVNAAFTDLTGYSRDEVVGKNPRLLSSGRQNHEFYADMWKTLIELGHWEGEVWNRRKYGEAYLEKLSIHTLKDFRGSTVNRIGIFSDITLSREAQATITHQAQHDFLTNLPNRLLFRDRFNQQLATAKRFEKKFAVIFLDLDQFKPVNDTLGHQLGDQLLIAVANRLTAVVREIDTVSRFGGDEFAILISEVGSQKDVTTLADKILATLRQPFTLGDHAVTVSASLGIAIYPDQGSGFNEIMNRADAAMYQAKGQGKNTYC